MPLTRCIQMHLVNLGGGGISHPTAQWCRVVKSSPGVGVLLKKNILLQRVCLPYRDQGLSCQTRWGHILPMQVMRRTATSARVSGVQNTAGIGPRPKASARHRSEAPFLPPWEHMDGAGGQRTDGRMAERTVGSEGDGGRAPLESDADIATGPHGFPAWVWFSKQTGPGPGTHTLSKQELTRAHPTLAPAAGQSK